MIHVWELAEAPAAVSFSDPEDSATTVTFSAPGRYVLRLTVDDGEAVDHTATAEVTISVVSRQMRFQRDDANADGELDIDDGTFILKFLFTGGPQPDYRAVGHDIRDFSAR